MIQDFKVRLVIPLLSCLCLLSACVLPQKRAPGGIDYVALAAKPLPPEQSSAAAGEAGANWLYGQGLGDTALKAGTAVAFPPYLLVLLGNAALSLSGYETVGVSNFLPEAGRGVWSGFYDGVTSAPGHLSAAVAGKEFRTAEIGREKLSQSLEGGGY